jgi:hypothetical protein
VTHPSAIPMLVRFLRSAASVDIDKSDVRRFRQFVDEQIDGLSVALAGTLRVIDPKLPNPTTSDWERSFALFRLIF